MNVVLVALYRYQNFPIRIIHSLLENIEGVNPYTIFFKNCDTNIFRVPTGKEEYLFVNQILALDPKVIGISVLSPYVPIARRLTRLIKEKSSALVIWGGIHPTISPETCIKETDIICIGEGEGAITDIVTQLRDGNDYLHIKNLWINNNGCVVKNTIRPLIQELDILPYPSYGRNTFSFIDYNIIVRDDPTLLDRYLWIQTSRGCPYVCSYCVNSLLRPMFKDHGTYTRRRSVDNVLKEIKKHMQLSRNVKEYVFFVDEVFGDEESWVDEFVPRYKDEVGLPFCVEYNPKRINTSIFSKLVTAGLHTINIGVQTGSDTIRNKIFHRPGKNSEIINIAKYIVKNNIKIKYDLIMDNPYDNVESLENTIRFLLQLPKPLSFNLFSLQYFPDYPLTKKAIEDGCIKEEEASINTLMERTTRNWAYIPKLFPYVKKQQLQNIIWLIVWNHVGDSIVQHSVFGNSVSSRLCFCYLNFKSIFMGKILGVGGILVKYRFISDLISVVKYAISDRSILYQKVKKRIVKRKII